MKKMMIPFLIEWLVKYGTDPVDTNNMDTYPLTMLIKATRLGYIADVQSNGHRALMKITKEGIRYLQENQK